MVSSVLCCISIVMGFVSLVNEERRRSFFRYDGGAGGTIGGPFRLPSVRSRRGVLNVFGGGGGGGGGPFLCILVRFLNLDGVGIGGGGGVVPFFFASSRRTFCSTTSVLER